MSNFGEASLREVQGSAKRSAISWDGTAEMENPGALAGASGAKSKGPIFKSEEYRMRFDAARTLCDAIRDCHPEDVVTILDAALNSLRPGQPPLAFRNVMIEAETWAAFATRNERKCYALAAFLALGPTDRRAFLAHAHRCKP